jgi:hypothetical protein
MKLLKVRLEIDTMIPETDSSDYYLPKHMKGIIHFLRQAQHLPVHINDKDARFHIPVRLNSHKSTFYYQLMVSSVEEFRAIFASRFVVTFYEEEDEILYAKGITSAHNVLGAV